MNPKNPQAASEGFVRIRESVVRHWVRELNTARNCDSPAGDICERLHSSILAALSVLAIEPAAPALPAPANAGAVDDAMVERAGLTVPEWERRAISQGVSAALAPAAQQEGAGSGDQPAADDSAELAEWRALFSAYISQGLRDVAPVLVEPLWPCPWRQDVALIAFTLHRADEARQQLAATIAERDRVQAALRNVEAILYRHAPAQDYRILYPDKPDPIERFAAIAAGGEET